MVGSMSSATATLRRKRRPALTPFAATSVSTFLLTSAQRDAAGRAARTAYLHGLYGQSTHNWLDAEIACAGHIMTACGLPADHANELGRRIAGDVVREIETATPAQPF